MHQFFFSTDRRRHSLRNEGQTPAIYRCAGASASGLWQVPAISTRAAALRAREGAHPEKPRGDVDVTRTIARAADLTASVGYTRRSCRRWRAFHGACHVCVDGVAWCYIVLGLSKRRGARRFYNQIATDSALPSFKSLLKSMQLLSGG